jgi:hypothetical protein
MKTKKHVIELPERSAVCTVTEHANQIIVTLEFSRYGVLDNDVELADWLGSIFEPYGKDKRPIAFDNPLSCDAALAATLRKPALAALLIAWGGEFSA